MTGTAAPLDAVNDSMICARCDGPMVIRLDALRRPRKRCPKCDGLAPTRPLHPDEVKVPVRLTTLTAAALPPVEPGQLRCQRCAKGLEGQARFCESCTRARLVEKRQRVCVDCRLLFLPKLGGSPRCEPCKQLRKAPKTRLCTGCNRISRRTRGPAVVSHCSSCPKPQRAQATRLCLNCGSERPRRGGRPTCQRCPLCPPRLLERIPGPPSTKTRPCPGCGSPVLVRRGPPKRRCEACP